MPILNTATLEALLASFRPTKPELAEGWLEFVAVPKKALSKDYGCEDAPAVTFWYRQDAGLSMESFLKRTMVEFEKLGHPVNLELTATVMALFAYSKGPAASAVERFNAMFSQVVNADVNQFFLFPQLTLSTYRVEIGQFGIGPFATERLAYLSQKAGSDFYDRYQAGLREIPFSVERKTRSVRVVYWHRLVGRNGQWIAQSKAFNSILGYLVDEYFAHLSAIYFTDFFNDLYRAQEMAMALGSGWFDLQRLRAVLGSHQISVYLKIGGENVGHVSPSSSLVLGINLGGGHLGMPLTQKYLYRNFGFEGFTDCEIHRSLRSFCQFLALAAQHRSSGRGSEAFLHNVIALDLLLGDSGSSTRTVTTRSAAMVSRALNRDYQAILKDLVRIYDARSKYVHKGEQPESELLPLVGKICGEVAFCLLRLQRESANRTLGFRDRWMKELNLVIAAIEAGRVITDDDWRRVGAMVGGDVRHADLVAALEHPTEPKGEAV